MPALANQAQIIRCFQRDSEAVNRIEAEIKELLCDLLPSNTGVLSNVRSLHSLITRLLYYYYTTLSGNQTLGEEYVGIVLSRPNLLTPSKFNLFYMIMLRVMGPYILPYTLKLWEKSMKESNPKDQEDLIQSARKVFIVKESLATVQIVKNGIFYFTGSLYDFAMLFSGIKYMFLRPWLQDDKIIYYFRLLGAITLIHSVIYGVDKYFKLQQVCGEDCIDETIAGSSDLSGICYLCMEKRKNTSATPCGHLFCWNCIIDAVRVKNVCPLCREKVNPSRVVLLKNYD